MSDFVGRTSEIKLILGSLRKDRGVLNVVRGRRRIGKTRLIKQLPEADRATTLYYLTSAPPSQSITDKEERDLYAAQVKQVFNLAYQPPAQSWRELFLFIADQCKGKKVILAIDEINWLARKSRTFLSEFHTLWETCFSQKKNFMLIVAGSLSSWIKDNFVMHQGYVGRVSKDIVLKELSLQDSAAFFGSRLQRLSSYEVIKQLCTTGGVPRYLEEIDPRKSADANIKELFFSPSGMLFGEFDKIFNDLFSNKNSFYRRILETIAGSSRLLTTSELARKMRLTQSGRFTDALDVLCDAGFLVTNKIWDTSGKKLSTKHILRISDSYTAFYFRAIAPNLGKISDESPLPKALPSLIGLQFENLIQNNQSILLDALNIKPADVIYQGPHYQSKTQKRAGCQVDHLIHTRQNNLYICEAKLYAGMIERSIIQEVQQKLDRLVQPRGTSFRPVLIHANQVSESVIESDFFDEIIDLGTYIPTP